MQRVLITGANRGIGLLLARLYAERGDVVFAACRNTAGAGELERVAARRADAVHILPLEVTDEGSIDAAVQTVSGKTDSLGILINNAGILPGGVSSREPASARFGSLRAEAVLEVFRVNAVAPVMVTQAFAGLLRAGRAPRVINVSSDAGSLGRHRGQSGTYAYPASKTALNMMTRCMAADLREAGVIVVSVHPGFVRTDMGGPGAPRAPEETVPTLLEVIDRLTIEDSGGFLNWDGSPVPW